MFSAPITTPRGLQRQVYSSVYNQGVIVICSEPDFSQVFHMHECRVDTGGFSSIRPFAPRCSPCRFEGFLDTSENTRQGSWYLE